MGCKAKKTNKQYKYIYTIKTIFLSVSHFVSKPINVLQRVNMNKWLVSGSQSIFLVSMKFPSLLVESLTSGVAKVRINGAGAIQGR